MDFPTAPEETDLITTHEYTGTPLFKSSKVFNTELNEYSLCKSASFQVDSNPPSVTELELSPVGECQIVDSGSGANEKITNCDSINFGFNYSDVETGLTYGSISDQPDCSDIDTSSLTESNYLSDGTLSFDNINMTRLDRNTCSLEIL